MLFDQFHLGNRITAFVAAKTLLSFALLNRSIGTYWATDHPRFAWKNLCKNGTTTMILMGLIAYGSVLPFLNGDDQT